MLSLSYTDLCSLVNFIELSISSLITVELLLDSSTATNSKVYLSLHNHSLELLHRLTL